MNYPGPRRNVIKRRTNAPPPPLTPQLFYDAYSPHVSRAPFTPRYSFSEAAFYTLHSCVSESVTAGFLLYFCERPRRPRLPGRFIIRKAESTRGERLAGLRALHLLTPSRSLLALSAIEFQCRSSVRRSLSPYLWRSFFFARLRELELLRTSARKREDDSGSACRTSDWFLSFSFCVRARATGRDYVSLRVLHALAFLQICPIFASPLFLRVIFSRLGND